MSDTHPQATLDTSASEVRLNRFEALWRAWREGEPVPRWQDHLPADDEACNPDLIFHLLRVDIACRVKAGLFALLAESYFVHPRLQHDDACLDEARQVELIHWEYDQRLQHGTRPRKAEYEAAFPRLLEALREMKPRSRCLQCGKILVLEETFQTLACPDCGCESSLDPAPPYVAGTTPAKTLAAELDLRDYQLVEQLGKGGMGEVYRCCDPALGRDLAIKVMAVKYRGSAEVERRFLREARITSWLQHPNIVAVHNLGRLTDGRLHYTMRLVRGDTFAAFLKDKAGKPERLSELLTIFEKVCQTVAYAHSKRVIHRDLKPANVMVGKYGEVQVMDWGLAKVLSNADAADVEKIPDATDTRILTESDDTPMDLSRIGSGMGTPAYMPLEQALGEWDTVDERADVFALGSILCEILIGQPAYSGADGNEVYRRAKRGDVAEALGRLQQCGADAALKTLCQNCLSPDREGRPCNARVLAEHVEAHQKEVQERLRKAELKRVAAEARAEEEQARVRVEQERTKEALARAAAEAERSQEAQARAVAERRARQRLLALAVSILVLLSGGGAAAWWMQQVRSTAQVRQDQTDREVLAGLEQARKRLEEGWRQQDLVRLIEVRAEAERMADIARSGGAHETVIGQAISFQNEVKQRLVRATQNQEFRNALLDIAMPHETRTYREDKASGLMLALADPSLDEQFAAAFGRRWPDVDLLKQEAATLAARLLEEPEVVLQWVIAGLDGWMVERRKKQRPVMEWRPLLELAQLLDASEPRRQLRAILSDAMPVRTEAVVSLLAGMPPWLSLWDLARGQHWRHLRQLRSQMKVADESVLTVLLLAQVSVAVKDAAGAEEILRLALARRPGEAVLLHALGTVLERQGRLAEAIGCYRAARATHPGLGVSLAQSLRRAGQGGESEAILHEVIRRQESKNPELFLYLGDAFYSQRQYVQAEKAYSKAIALKRDYAAAHHNLGLALYQQRKYADAVTAFHKAITYKPNFASAYNNLGNALDEDGKPREAEKAFRKAIECKQDLLEAYVNLGIALRRQGKYVAAEKAIRTAITLRPNLFEAHLELGMVLERLGQYVGAEKAFHQAIALKPDDAEAYATLGILLADYVRKPVEAEVAFRQAIALKPDAGEIYHNLGVALQDQGKEVEAEAAYLKAIELRQEFARSYANLGGLCLHQGRFTEATAFLQRASELQAKQPAEREKLLQLLRAAKQFAELDKKLPAILTGEASPANAPEAVLFASMCQKPYKKRYAASARLYADAFATDPRLTDALKQPHRYNAACSAVLAAVGQDVDARLLPDKVAVMFRRWALGWLRDDLTTYTKLAERNIPAANKAIQQRLVHWQTDTDLASIRDPQALDGLPENERAAWESLWRDVDALAKRLAKPIAKK